MPATFAFRAHPPAEPEDSNKVYLKESEMEKNLEVIPEVPLLVEHKGFADSETGEVDLTKKMGRIKDAFVDIDKSYIFEVEIPRDSLEQVDLIRKIRNGQYGGMSLGIKYQRDPETFQWLDKRIMEASIVEQGDLPATVRIAMEPDSERFLAAKKFMEIDFKREDLKEALYKALQGQERYLSDFIASTEKKSAPRPAETLTSTASRASSSSSSSSTASPSAQKMADTTSSNPATPAPGTPATPAAVPKLEPTPVDLNNPADLQKRTAEASAEAKALEETLKAHKELQALGLTMQEAAFAVQELKKRVQAEADAREKEEAAKAEQLMNDTMEIIADQCPANTKLEDWDRYKSCRDEIRGKRKLSLENATYVSSVASKKLKDSKQGSMRVTQLEEENQKLIQQKQERDREAEQYRAKYENVTAPFRGAASSSSSASSSLTSTASNNASPHAAAMGTPQFAANFFAKFEKVIKDPTGKEVKYIPPEPRLAHRDAFYRDNVLTSTASAKKDEGNPEGIPKAKAAIGVHAAKLYEKLLAERKGMQKGTRFALGVDGTDDQNIVAVQHGFGQVNPREGW